MSTEHQIHQFKETIMSNEFMLTEQSALIQTLNKQIDALQAQLEDTNNKHSQSIKKLQDESLTQLSLFRKQSSEELATVDSLSNELERIITEREVRLKSKDSLIEKLTKQLEDSQKQQYQNEGKLQEMTKQITELEQILIETKLKLATQSGDLDEAKGEILRLKRKVSESEIIISRRSSDDSTGSNSNNSNSSITNIGAPILSQKNYDIACKTSAVQQNRQLILDLQKLSQMRSSEREVISPEHVLHRLVMNTDCLFFPSNQKAQGKLAKSQNLMENTKAGNRDSNGGQTNYVAIVPDANNTAQTAPGMLPQMKQSSSFSFSISQTASPVIMPVVPKHSASDLQLNTLPANSKNQQDNSRNSNGILMNGGSEKTAMMYQNSQFGKAQNITQCISPNLEPLCSPNGVSIAAMRLSQLDNYCEQVVGKNMLSLILNQPPPTFLVLSQAEQNEVCKALSEVVDSSSTSKPQQITEIQALLDTRFLYSDWRSDAVIQKINILLKKGPLPLQIRKRVWPLLIGNKLRITKIIYKNLEEQMKTTPISYKASTLIREDMHRTYPTISIFDKGSQTNQTLQRILEQFHYFRPDIGYVQGMAYPAAILFLYLGDSYLVFKYLNNLIAGNNFLSNLYKFKVAKIKVYLSTFEYFLGQKQPNCVKHLNKLNITSDIFLIEWFYTLFCRAFSFPIVAKIWDMMLTQGEVTFYRVAVSIFTCIEKELLDKSFDDSLFLIRNCTFKIDTDQLLKQIYSQKITTEQMLKKYAKSIEEQEKPLTGQNNSTGLMRNNITNVSNDGKQTNSNEVKTEIDKQSQQKLSNGKNEQVKQQEQAMEQSVMQQQQQLLEQNPQQKKSFDFAGSVQQLKDNIQCDFLSSLGQQEQQLNQQQADKGLNAQDGSDDNDDEDCLNGINIGKDELVISKHAGVSEEASC